MATRAEEALTRNVERARVMRDREERRVATLKTQIANGKDEIERLAHGICDMLKLMDEEAEVQCDPSYAQTERAVARGLLNGTAHEGHRPNPFREMTPAEQDYAHRRREQEQTRPI